MSLTLIQLRANTADSDLVLWLDDRRNRRAFPYRLEQCGYVPVRNPSAPGDGLWKISGKRQAIYAKAALGVREQIKAAQAIG